MIVATIICMGMCVIVTMTVSMAMRVIVAAILVVNVRSEIQTGLSALAFRMFVCEGTGGSPNVHGTDQRQSEHAHAGAHHPGPKLWREQVFGEHNPNACSFHQNRENLVPHLVKQNADDAERGTTEDREKLIDKVTAAAFAMGMFVSHV